MAASRQAVEYIVWCEEKLVWILCEFFIQIHTNLLNSIKSEDQKTSIYCGLFRLSEVQFLQKSQLQNRVSMVFIREVVAKRVIILKGDGTWNVISFLVYFVYFWCGTNVMQYINFIRIRHPHPQLTNG